MHGLCRARPRSPPGEIGTTLEPRARKPLTTKAALASGPRGPCRPMQGVLDAHPLVGLDSGGGIRTRDLRVMSPTSYQTAPPRGGFRRNCSDSQASHKQADDGGCMPRKTCATLLALAALAAAPTVPAAEAATSETSSNWAGYAVSGSGIRYRHVSATWTQKAVDCSTTSGRAYSAYWVGLGGLSTNAQALEQIGTDADCSSSGRATYVAWYELVPQAAVNIRSLTIRSGDRLSA